MPPPESQLRRHCNFVSNTFLKNWQWVTLIAAALVILIRLPVLLLEGRFWAEDGVLFFRQAYLSTNALDTFFSPEVGYYTLVNRLAGFVSANLTPLEYAPLVHNWLALLFQLLPATVILFSHIPGIETRRQKLLAIALILFLIPNVETWLSLTLSHFHHGLALALIMVSKSDYKLMRWLRYVTVILAGLNSPLPCFLLPFFWLFWFFNRERPKLNECILLTLFTLIQVWVVITTTHGAPRHYILSFSFVPYAIMVKQFLIPLAGWDYAQTQIDYFRITFLQNYWKLAWIIPLLYGAVLALIIRYKDKVAAFFFFSGIFVLFLSLVADLGIPNAKLKIVYIHPIIGGRYFFIPSLLFFLCLLVLSNHRTNLPQKVISFTLRAVLVWVVAVGMLNYFPKDRELTNEFTSGPSWKEEVTKWREDPNYLLHIWPERKTLQLPVKEEPD